MNEKKGKIEKSVVNPKTLHRSVNLGGLQCRTSLSWPKCYIEFVDRFVTEEQKYDWWFGLIDCEIKTTSE